MPQLLSARRLPVVGDGERAGLRRVGRAFRGGALRAQAPRGPDRRTHRLTSVRARTPRVAEHYVRPPLIAVEPPSPRAARWRFRLVVGLIFLVVIGLLALLLFTVILSNSEGNPGLNPQGLANSTVASVPPSGAGFSVS